MSANTASVRERRVALIDEAQCVGCMLCIQACPFDAVVGAHHQMHTVVSALCTGCNLCLPPCPMDCIALVPATGDDSHWDRTRAVAARARRKARSARLERDQAERAARLARRALEGSST